MSPAPARWWRLAAALLLAALAGPLQAADELGSARAATDRHDYAQALVVYERLLAARPDDADLLIEVARVNGFADRNAEAARLYRRVLVVAPARRADVLAALAWQALWAGEPAPALALFDELLAADAPRPLAAAARAELLDGRAQARQALGDQAGALAGYREALAALPPGGTPQALQRRLALSLLWNDRHDEAITTLQAILAQQPDDRDSAWALANAQNFAGLHRQALRTFVPLGPPRNDGERVDLARAWRWAGYEDQAAPLLAGQADREAQWLRDWRVARELAPYAYATVEHSVDRDRLESLAWVAGAGWHPSPGASLEAQARQVEFDDANGQVRAQQFQLLYRWRGGQATDESGSWWPTVALRASSLPGWTPLAPTLRLTWLPRDRWRVDAELARELVETPMAVAHRVTVDALSIGLDHRPDARWSFAGSAAALRFDDGNVRLRLSGRAEWTLAMKPRWVVGIDGMQFGSSRPASDTRSSRGYWNPRRYGEVRATTTLTHEARPFDLYARLALGTALEVDGDGRRSHGTPNQWELGLGLDLAPSLRLRLAGGGAGNGFGLSNGGAGYWRRYLNLSINGWF